MDQQGGFQNGDHEAAFRAGNRLFRRGGSYAAVCGARTRRGALCQNLPIREGTGRCLNHAGPHAARAHRERQLRAFETGRISAEVWNRAEARRAANRLGYQWKKNPWTAGSTIDLGAHERAFLDALEALGGVRADALPPAVADWLRWRYRRTQIDHQNETAWLRVVRDVLPGRIAKAGPRPPCGGARPVGAADVNTPTSTSATSTPAWRLDACPNNPSFKRRIADKPQAPKIVRGKGYQRLRADGFIVQSWNQAGDLPQHMQTELARKEKSNDA